MKKTIVLLVIGLCFMLSGCVKQEEYDELNTKLTYANQENGMLKTNNADLEKQIASLEAQVNELQAQVNDLQAKNEELQAKERATETPAELPQEVSADMEPTDNAAPIVNPGEYRTDVTYDDLSRRPDDYLYQNIEVSGTVIQLIEGDGENQLRVALSYNGYEDVVLVGYEPKIVSERILVDDYITIKGMSVGIFQYESTLGGLISVPAIYAMEITRD